MSTRFTKNGKSRNQWCRSVEPQINRNIRQFVCAKSACTPLKTPSSDTEIAAQMICLRICFSRTKPKVVKICHGRISQGRHQTRSQDIMGTTNGHDCLAGSGEKIQIDEWSSAAGSWKSYCWGEIEEVGCLCRFMRARECNNWCEVDT